MLNEYRTLKLKFTLFHPHANGSWGEILEFSKYEVPWNFQGDQKWFIMGVWGPTFKCAKHLEETNVKIYKNAEKNQQSSPNLANQKSSL